MTPYLGGPAALISAALGVLGVEQVADSGPDLQGIALLITSISGLIATIGALVIGLRKRDDTTERMLKILEEQAKKDEP